LFSLACAFPTDAAPFAPALAAPVICIDPGHPSEVGRGTQGRHLTEIQAAWQVAKKLQAVLIARGYRTVLTKRSEEQFVTNKARAETANQINATLMVRLHCDADAGSGLAVYAPDRRRRGRSMRLWRAVLWEF
jgi:N-acetylmuramoyl-L-alanine amidase